jgi:hypothetical protein
MNRKLQVFLYLLIRDGVPFGVIERILKDVEMCRDSGAGLLKEPVFSENLMAAYASKLADRLMDDGPDTCRWMLEYLNMLGGLGHDKHQMIADVLAGKCRVNVNNQLVPK